MVKKEETDLVRTQFDIVSTFSRGLNLNKRIKLLEAQGGKILGRKVYKEKELNELKNKGRENTLKLFELIRVTTNEWKKAEEIVNKGIYLLPEEERELLLISVKKAPINFIKTVLDLDLELNFFIKDNITDEDLTLLGEGCKRGKKVIVEALIEKRANVNLITKEGKSPLHFLSSSKSFELLDIFTLLVDNGINLKDSHISVSLFYLFYQNVIVKGDNLLRNIITDKLIKLKENVNKYEHFNQSPLYICMKKDWLDTSKKLLEEGAHVQDLTGKIHLPLNGKTKEKILLLLEYGVNVNKIDEDGNNIIMASINLESSLSRKEWEEKTDLNDILDILLENNLNINLVNKNKLKLFDLLKNFHINHAILNKIL